MNKTININLGGYPFTIDEDAFDVANNYLNALTRHFGGSEGATEIMQDIESRMGELVNKTRGTRVIVNKIDILDAIAILGTPEELKDIDFSEMKAKEKNKGRSFQIKTGKRLFRDPDDKIIGGVCSGLAAYFGIQDAIWIRITFILLALAGGASFVVYAALWILVPAAQTVSDRLEMMGEPTNVNNIARMVKEELEDLSDKIQDQFGKKSKKHHGHSKHHDSDQMMTSGWSWDKKSTKENPTPFNQKDFV